MPLDHPSCHDYQAQQRQVLDRSGLRVRRRFGRVTWSNISACRPGSRQQAKSDLDGYESVAALVDPEFPNLVMSQNESS